MSEKPKIGVFICGCGGNISDTVDVQKVKETAAKMKDVKVAEFFEYICSDPGQNMIRDGIKEQRLNRIVVACCSPRMHLKTFMQTVKKEGLNPFLLEIANIREQCSWIHDQVEAATPKAIDLVRGAVGRARHLQPLESKTLSVTQKVLVIGGGISGIIASLELADKGYQVYLVEKSPSIGGHMAQLSKTYPTLDCSACILTPKMVDVSQHPNIEVITMAEPVMVDGSPGNYKVLIKKHTRFVDDKCTACGECEKTCPVKVPSEFEAELLPRKAIYTPFKQAVPRTYVIDQDHCLFLNKGTCRICEKICKGKAINFDQNEETVELEVGTIVVCTGFEQINPKTLDEYNFGLHPDIITNLQFERLMEQNLHKPSNDKTPKKVAFVLCAGSRLTTDRGVEHCCKIGCMAAIKQAMLLQKVVRNAEPWIFYTDIRADNKGCEEFYNTALNHKVRFVRGRVSRVLPNGEKVVIHAEDTLLGKFIEEKFDLVVLSMGTIPRSDTDELARMLRLQVGSDGFLLERHYKLQPVDSQREGIFLAGCALGPKDVRETTLESMATASRVASFLGKGEISRSPEVAYIIPERCNECGECLEFCPLATVENSTTGITINPISCVGCGICVPKCPQQAIELSHCTEKQLLAQIDGICNKGEGTKIVAFLENNVAYASADLAGQTRHSYPPNVEIIGIPSVGRIGIKDVLHTFAAGADGIVFVEGHGSILEDGDIRDHMSELKKQLKKYDVSPLRLMSITTTLPQYNKILNIFETISSRISKIGGLTQDKRDHITQQLNCETSQVKSI